MVTAVGMLTVRGQADDWTLDNTELASSGSQLRSCVSVSDTEGRQDGITHMYNAGIESCRLYLLLTIKEAKYISDHNLINEHFKTM